MSRIFDEIKQGLEEALQHEKILNAFRVNQYSNNCEVVHYLSPQSMAIFNEVFRLFERMVPGKMNAYRQAWVSVPRGTIMDCGFEDEQEACDYLYISDKNLLQEAFQDAFPEERYWYQIQARRYEKSRMLRIGEFSICIDESRPLSFVETPGDYYELLMWMLSSMRKIIAECEKGTYNDRIDKELPYTKRYGVVQRKVLWDNCPEYRKHHLKTLTQEEIDRFISFLREETGQPPTGRIKDMTFNQYFDYAAKAFENMGVRTEGATPRDLFECYGEDFGGRLFDNVDLDSPKDFYRFYNGEWRMGGHPWGLYRGTSRSRVMLQPQLDNDGYYFIFSGDPNWCIFEMVKLYLGLKNAGLPMAFAMPKVSVAYLLEEDKVGFVMDDEPLLYCHSDFKEYIDDFYHYGEENEPIKDIIEWYPVEHITLKESNT